MGRIVLALLVLALPALDAGADDQFAFLFSFHRPFLFGLVDAFIKFNYLI